MSARTERCYRVTFRSNRTGHEVEIDAYRNTRTSAERGACVAIANMLRGHGLDYKQVGQAISVAVGERFEQCPLCGRRHSPEACRSTPS